jgi:hypothetical protein
MLLERSFNELPRVDRELLAGPTGPPMCAGPCFTAALAGKARGVPGKRGPTRRGERHVAQRNGIEETVSGVVEGVTGRTNEVTAKVNEAREAVEQ